MSWNNFCYQSCVIVAPLILSAVYEWNINATYYISVIPALLGTCVMGYVSTWQNAKTLGRPCDEDTEQKDVEMANIPNTSEEKKEPTESKTVEEINNDDDVTKTPVVSVTPVTSVTPVDVNVQEYFCLFV